MKPSPASAYKTGRSGCRLEQSALSSTQAATLTCLACRPPLLLPCYTMTSALRLLLAVQASLLLSGTLGAPGTVQAGRHLLAATPPSSIINTILAAGKGFNSFGQTTPQALPAPASAFSLPTTTTTMPSSSGDATCSLPVAPWECRFTLVGSA